MESSTIATVRDIFVIVAAGVLAAAGITAIVLVIKLFKPLREIVENTAVSSRNLRKLSGELAAKSPRKLRETWRRPPATQLPFPRT